MLELYHNDMSVCSAKVRIVLAEKGSDWKARHLDLRAGDAQKPEYLKMNPNAVVPTLVHGGRVLIESTVICEYLDDAFAQPPLKPKDAFAVAKMRLWTKQLDDGVHAATGTVSTCIAFRHQHLKKPAEERKRYFDAIPSAERRERIQKAVELGMDSPGFAPAIRRFDKLLGDMEKTLGDTDWLAGTSYSLADVAYTPYMIRLDHLGFEGMIKHRPRVAAWKERLYARPSYEPAVAKWFNAEYLKIFDEQRDTTREKLRNILQAA